MIPSRAGTRSRSSSSVSSAKSKSWLGSAGRALDLLNSEAETYDQYLTGEVFGYEATDWDGELIDSCWGFYGYETVKEDGYVMTEHAKPAIDAHIDRYTPAAMEQPGEH